MNGRDLKILFQAFYTFDGIIYLYYHADKSVN